MENHLRKNEMISVPICAFKSTYNIIAKFLDNMFVFILAWQSMSNRDATMWGYALCERMASIAFDMQCNAICQYTELLRIFIPPPAIKENLQNATKFSFH